MSDAAAALIAAAREPGYTPPTAALGPLLEALAGVDERTARALVRVLARREAAAASVAIERFGAAAAAARPWICELVGRVASATRAAALGDWLVARLAEPDARTRRRAIVALGKLAEPRYEAALLARWHQAPELAERRALAAALGRLGSDATLRALAQPLPADPELARLAEQARVKVARDELRTTPGRIDDGAVAARPPTLLLHVRAGLEPLLLEELPPKLEPRLLAPGRVAITLDGPLRQLWVARTFLDCGFPLPLQRLPGPPVEAARSTTAGSEAEAGALAQLAAAVVAALTSPLAVELFRTFTRGPVRYRLEWAQGGARRALTWRLAAEVARRNPELINDPRQALWQVVVSERVYRGSPTAALELWPQGLQDPRFAYRVRTLPASSHPTLAAALARVAGVQADDVVWDPFVGAATELIERARLGPAARFYGSDDDPAALAAAAENLQAAGLGGVTLVRGDARRWRPPEPVSLVMTNPPMGRRLLAGPGLGPLLATALANAAAALRPGGRIVLLSPLPELTLQQAETHGLRPTRRHRVDMGGFSAELQAFVAAARGGGRAAAGGRRGRVLSTPAESS